MAFVFQAHPKELKILEITVRNKDFEVIRVVQELEVLKEAEKAWQKLKPIDSLPNTNWTHKLDVTSESIGGRWLYNKEGYLAKLNKQLKPMYKVSDVSKFNEIYLGL